MALLKLNNTAILTGEIDMCLNGMWQADLRVDGTTKASFNVGDNVTIQATDGSFSLAGTIIPDRFGTLLSVLYCRVVGGKNGLINQATAKAFSNGLVSDVLNSLMSDAGETLSDTIDQSILNTQLANWVIIQDPVCFQLNVLAKEFEWNWRFLPDGTLWIGVETYPNFPTDFNRTLLDYDVINSIAPYGVDSPVLTPGYTLDGYQAARVIHSLTETTIRTNLYQPQTSGDRSPLTSIYAIIDNRTAPLDFFTGYEVKVISQSSDLLSVDVQPTDTRLPGMQNIPIRIGLGGASIQLIPNALMMLFFDNGDPKSPYVTTFMSEKITKMTLTDASGNSYIINNGIQIKAANTTWFNLNAGSLTLGSNPVATAVLTLGSVDGLGIPVTNSPTNTNTVLSG